MIFYLSLVFSHTALKKKKHAKRKKTQKSNKKGKTSLASLCTNEKTKQQISRETRQKKRNSPGNPVYNRDKRRGWGERVEANLKHYFLCYQLYSIHESLR